MKQAISTQQLEDAYDAYGTAVYRLAMAFLGQCADAEDVTGTPTFILYCGGRKVWRESGEMPGEVLLNKITSHIKK